MTQVDFLVIGGGISGLTTAWSLKQQGRDVLLLEAKEKVGGNIKSKNVDGWLLEEGPNSLLVNRQQVLDLFHDLEIESEVVLANEVSKNRFIFRDGRLHALPGSPISFLGTGLFSFKDKLRLFAEPFIGKAKEEETIAEFVTRRLGKGFYDYAINPFVSGVYAGDPHLLSARAATRKVYALEEKHGSLVKGALAMVLGQDRPEGRIKGRMLSFRDGMATLPLAIGSALGGQVITKARVESMQSGSKGWSVQTHEDRYEAKHVVLASTAREAARLLGNDEAYKELANIDYVPIAVMHLGFHAKDIRHALNGFGCLVPRKEGVKLLGALFSSSMFPGRSPSEEHALVTCFIGGATFRDIANWDDEEIEGQVLCDLDRLIGFESEPIFKNLVRYERSIPQYTMGHLERMNAIQSRVAALPNVTTRANWHDGISVSDCILNSMNHGRQLAP